MSQFALRTNSPSHMSPSSSSSPPSSSSSPPLVRSSSAVPPLHAHVQVLGAGPQTLPSNRHPASPTPANITTSSSSTFDPHTTFPRSPASPSSPLTHQSFRAASAALDEPRSTVHSPSHTHRVLHHPRAPPPTDFQRQHQYSPQHHHHQQRQQNRFSHSPFYDQPSRHTPSPPARLTLTTLGDVEAPPPGTSSNTSPLVRRLIQVPNPASAVPPQPSPISPRSDRRSPASPLSSVLSPPSPLSASPDLSAFSFGFESTTNAPSPIEHAAADTTESQTTSSTNLAPEQSFYYHSDSSNPATPTPPDEPATSIESKPDTPNDTQIIPDPPLSPQSPALTADSPTLAMPSPTTISARGDGTQPIPRNSSMDSAISQISTMSGRKGSGEASLTPDIAHLIQTAGSPEAVIQYLLKEKQSQSQQNSQLWRLVDKQRAMILGLNKDLERALKDKEKYRKKLKEVLALPGLSTALRGQPIPGQADSPSSDSREDAHEAPKHGPVVAPVVPDSPTLDSDSQKHSPVDMTMAPYPITPPADQPPMDASRVRDLLDPSSSMPKAHDHALDRFDHDAEERAAQAAADRARRKSDAEGMRDLPINMNIPPSRSLPSEPPRMPPPRPPPAPPSGPAASTAPKADDRSQLAAPPRKAPPAPLQLDKTRPVASGAVEEEETDTDYDDILEVDEIINDKRGRRRTREEDERQREIMALKEAEIRGTSKKGASQSGQTGDLASPGLSRTPALAPTHVVLPPQPRTPRHAPPPLPLGRDAVPASLDSIMNGDTLAPAILSPGLPSSPRPFVGVSPPLSPRTAATFASGPLSPRPPRQPIPLPPNTPLATPSPPPSEPLVLSTPRPLNISKKGTEMMPPPPAVTITADASEPTRQGRIFKGLAPDEHPDLLLGPDALPSIAVRVASSRMKPSRASMMTFTQLEEDPVFTLAIFSRSEGRELWRVEKDSASLQKLDQRLKHFSGHTARVPERSLFNGHAPAKLDARRVALEVYLEEILNTPYDSDTALDVCRYLSVNTLPPNHEDAGAVGNEILDNIGSKTGPGGRPFRSGYLTKRGKNFGGWKARFFALEGPLLKYYETPGGAHLGTIKLQNAQIGKQSQQTNDNQSPARGSAADDLDNQYRHAFLILEPKKKDSSSHVKHVLCAENDKERDQWVDDLLQWIDYRDPENDSPVTSTPAANSRPGGSKPAHDRQASGDAEKTSKSGGKKKRDQTKSYHQQSDSDTLIGLRYDATKQGDAPSSGPSRPKTSSGLPDNPSEMFGYPREGQAQLPSISAPKDPQVISDSSAWGSKMGGAGGLVPPSLEEKKQRKRSFFGFGPKTRSASEGGDTLWGDGDKGSTPPQAEFRGPIRQVFGAPLAEAVRYNSPTDVNVPLPAVVYRSIQYLDSKNATLEEGIFRLSGSNVVIKQLRERFNNEGDVDLVHDETYYDIHAVASLLKLYLRELPTTILTRDLHVDFLHVTELTDQKEKIAGLGELVLKLPQANATLLKYLIAFLIKIINNSDVNKMTVRNVGIVFSPTLNIPAPVFAMFLQNYEGIFGIEPEEYELPSPASESDTQSLAPSNAPSRPSFEPRPSTANGTSSMSMSPHRQRLKQSVMDQPRGSPTPPLLMEMNGARASPTPPPSFPMNRQTTYEPQYVNQQATQGNNLRPSYENGFVTQSNFEATSFAGGPRPTPGYDQPIFEDRGYSNVAAYDQPLGTRRRESAVFANGPMMMNQMNQQGSKSRLREETKF